jgi:hypothetical protein
MTRHWYLSTLLLYWKAHLAQLIGHSCGEDAGARPAPVKLRAKTATMAPGSMLRLPAAPRVRGRSLVTDFDFNVCHLMRFEQSSFTILVLPNRP